jgi:hypothetical protein
MTTGKARLAKVPHHALCEDWVFIQKNVQGSERWSRRVGKAKPGSRGFIISARICRYMPALGWSGLRMSQVFSQKASEKSLAYNEPQINTDQH